MKFFNQMPASEAVNRGINPSCVLGRKMVCKAKEETLIGPKRNVVIVEKGEKIVCEYSDYSSGFDFCFTSIEALKNCSALQLIGDSWYEAESTLPFEDFKSKFEILDEETSQILPLFETVEKETSSIRDYRYKLHDAEFRIKKISNIVSGLFCLAVSIANIILVILASIGSWYKEVLSFQKPFYVAAYALVIVLVIFGFVFAALILGDVIDSPVQLKGFSAKVKAAEAEYDTVLSRSKLSIEAFKENMRWP
jgi:hypothetical protein